MSPSTKNAAWAIPQRAPPCHSTWARPTKAPGEHTLGRAGSFPACPVGMTCRSSSVTLHCGTNRHRTEARPSPSEREFIPVSGTTLCPISDFSKHQTSCWRAFATLLPAWLLKMKQSCGWLCSSFHIIMPVGWCEFAMKQERQHAQIWTRLNFQDWFLLFQAHLPGVEWNFYKAVKR